jgi:CHASE2 domain-containing sensor protein
MKLLLKTSFKQASKTVQRWTGFAIISLMTLGLVQFTILFPLSFERFNVAQNIFEQYNLVDTYFTIHENGGNSEQLDSTIVIVNMDGCSDRDTIAKYIDMIRSASPKAIGIDVHFANPYDCSDTNLVQVLSETPNLVVVNALDFLLDDSWNQFQEKQESFSECIDKPLNSGFSNLTVDSGYALSCRKFADYMFCNQDTVKSFASVIAQTVMPNEYETLIRRKKETEYINYNNPGFEKIRATDTETLSKQLYLLSNKIVLFSDLSDSDDKHITPINPQMSGIEIHAYILSTIKNENYINQMTEPVAWILAFFLIMLLVSFKYWLSGKNEWLSILMPVFQAIIILSGIFTGYCLFTECHYYIPVIRILIGMAIVGFPYDLYYKILKTIHNHKK